MKNAPRNLPGAPIRADLFSASSALATHLFRSILAGTALTFFVVMALDKDALAQSAPNPQGTMNTPAQTTSALAGQPVGALPLFYKQLIPFDRNAHKDIRLARTPQSYAFARESDIIPVVFTEAAFALMHYPIVFLDSGNGSIPTLSVVVGNGNRRNQFVSEKGQWRKDTYIPAWVRRYPFFVMKTAADGEPLLGFDPNADRLKSKQGERLLDTSNNPTSLLQEMITMNMEYQQAGLRTNQLCEALQKAGLLEPVTLRVQAPAADNKKAGGAGSGASHVMAPTPQESAPAITVGGFMVVNEAKLATLDKETLAQLHQSGALSLAYAHLISLQHLRKVFETASN